jgi:spermidine/putrescine ABC transporter ATP-binding subunit
MARALGQRSRDQDPLSTADVDVELLGVTKHFGSIVAVNDISLRIGRGEFFSLLGPSGCGKTTTLRLIGGFEYPTTGRVILQGRDVTDVPPYRRPTNMVFQQLALFPHLDVFENVAFGLRLRRLVPGEIAARVSRVLELVELPRFEQRQVHQLSGGQKQRVAIARALVNEPAVLLLDEPLGSLDLKLRLVMQAELKALQHRVGTTFIYVTHDQGEALTMSDRIAVMHDGRVVQVGPSVDIYTRPQTKFVATFIGEANLLQGHVVGATRESLLVAAGPLQVAATADGAVSTGTEVTLLIRPEHIKLGATAQACNNQWEGVVRDVIFIGSIIRYRISLGGAVMVTAELHMDDAHTIPVGTSVLVGWPSTRAVVLRE